MTRRSEGLLLQQFRTLFHLGSVGELTDGQLLERFATAGGDLDAAELAFAALVERHAPMVLRICRNHLRDPNDVEDAFQATFLVLVQKARALWVEDSLGPWIHRVARRIAVRAVTNAARRREREQGAAAAHPERYASPAADDGLMALLHEEIDRLPERCRVPVVLCDLQGLTHEQAARHLSWPVGTVKSRLMTGRERLRARLVRRGAAPAAVLIHVTLAGSARSAALAVPPALVEATVRAAGLIFRSTGNSAAGVVPAAVVLLMEGVRDTMLMTRIKLGLLACGLVAGGAVVAAQQSGHDPSLSRPTAVEPRSPLTIEARIVAPGDDDPAVAREVARVDQELLEKEAEMLKVRVSNALQEMIRVESMASDGDPNVGPQDKGRTRAAYESARRAYLGKVAEVARMRRRSGEITATAAGHAPLSQAGPDPRDSRTGPHASAAAVGSIDMDAVFKRYERVRRLQDRSSADVAEIRRRIVELEDRARNSKEMLERFQPNSPDYRAEDARLAELKDRTMAERERSERELTSRQSRDLTSVLEDVRDVIAELAQARGLDYVVKVSADPRADATPNDVHAAVNRSVVYANPRNDITEDVIRELNRRFQAAGNRPAK